MLDQHVDRFADDLSGFLDKGDLFSAFYRADLLHEIGGIFKLDGGKRGADLFEGSPRHDSFGRAHEAGEADDADALGADFLKTLDDRLAVRAERPADVLYPILRPA